MNNDNLSFIIDEQGRHLYFAFKPAENPQQAKTVFILHGHTFNAKPSNFVDKNWNVVCPIDNYGVDNSGSWWLGEKGDYFVKELLQQLVVKIKEITGSNRIYFWGSSMGGYGAIFHGIECKAEGVFAHIPQIKLKNTVYTDGIMAKYVTNVFEGADVDELDLLNKLQTINKSEMPCFFITQTRFDYNQYLEQQANAFIEKCNHLGLMYFYEIAPKYGHSIYRSVAQSIAVFDQYEQDIVEWLEKRKSG
ncbi:MULTISPECIES: alpha/beta hydrolase family protein [Acinetobacter]|uniref:alpha/beta hydrolase family protein n=1 Tax=Acinetobacter TaxID=469 RepID=UPI001F4B5A13|nr:MULTISPECIES: hypothetical protein [Acinetobacter]MCH7379966.1 hypothetical protein [Acinetobacter higginsii]